VLKKIPEIGSTLHVLGGHGVQGESGNDDDVVDDDDDDDDDDDGGGDE
jgi:hypothetical protein